MKKLILISLLLGLYGVNLMSQQEEPKRLPWDSVSSTLPPFKIASADTLRFFPGDTIPTPLWEKYLKKKSQERMTEERILTTPLDNMPVIVPPHHQFQMIVVKPDTTFHYFLRNLRDEEKPNSLKQKQENRINRRNLP